MPLRGYGVLVGQAVDERAEGGTDTPHYQIRLRAAGSDFRIAVNVLSSQQPSELLFVAQEDFRHPILPALAALPDGFTALSGQPGGPALDYIRGNLFDRLDMRPLPATQPGADNDLADKLHHFLSRAIADPAARVYAFGQRWGPEATTPDKIFEFSPGNGIHDIHMNQGNSGRFRGDNGVWQDGGLLFRFPATGRWAAVFLAFQSQGWHTDDTTGHVVPDLTEVGPAPRPASGEPDQRVRIVAALVNPAGPAPETESVTLVNTSPFHIDLAGWAFADQQKRRHVLRDLVIAAGDAVRVTVSPPMQLGNSGGLITLLDRRGLKVDGVSYTAAQAGREGWTITFH
ncbi:DUF2278 family protein [Candidatus Protofrankia californiensis]|uniref:DUF2278 family protein n=1 Tax=Candidatus Protofrankia californiensis TaxID=1839754 RepID=UPI00104193E8|nr:DUF2278 family protein [Candidatus Protofrankia californiensis]